MQKKLSSGATLWLSIAASGILLIGIALILMLVTGTSISETMLGSFAAEGNYATILSISIAVCAVFIVGGIVALALLGKYGDSTRKNAWSIRELVTGALCIGLAFVLSYFKLWEMPMGGSITPASMLPIMLFAYIYGFPRGIVVGVAYGLLQMIQDPWLLNLPQVLLDYILAFGSLSLAGLFKKSIIPGMVLGGIGRLVFAFLSGVIFFAEYAPEGMSPFVYSIGYQATYILPEMALCILITLIPGIRKNIEMLRRQAAKLPAAPSSANVTQ